MNDLIIFKDVYFSYKDSPALENINFKINKNEFVGVIGPNGGGKTTLLRLLLGFLKPDQGEVLIKGKNIKKIGPIIGYMPQYNKLDDGFPISVEEVIAMGLFKNTSFLPFIKKKDYKQIYEALKNVQIENLAKKTYGELSGGQKQRCLIARAIVSNPEILLLDEPTASVDSRVEKDIYELLKELNKNMTIILVSHDIGFISKYINRVFCINKRLVTHKTNDLYVDGFLNNMNDNETMMIKHHCEL